MLSDCRDARISGAGCPTLPVPVFFTYVEPPPLPPLRPEQHEAAALQTREAMFELAARLRKEHGDKTSAWPADVWETLYTAEERTHTVCSARSCA